MRQPSHSFQFVLLLAVALVLWWRPLASTFRAALTSESHTHILLIVPLSCALVYLQRKMRLPHSKPGLGAGSALLVVALLVAGFAKSVQPSWPEDVRLSLSMFALVTWLIGSVIFCFGTRAFQTFMLPLCILYWLVPIPEVVLEEIIYFLQQQSAFAARVMFLLIGVPVTQDGTLLSIPDLDIEVARACSSIRSSLMLVITTMVLAHLFLRSWWRKTFLIAAAVPLAAVKNGLRIVTIVQIGTNVDPGIFDSGFHHRGGIFFFAVSVVMTAGLLWVLRRTENGLEVSR